MRFRTPVWGALVVCLCVCSRAHAATIAVPAGGDLQAALNAAVPGDVITLEPGAVYTGNFTLPDKGASDLFITVRSAAPDASLPPAGVRMTPAYAAQLPAIQSPNSVSALRTRGSAHHWKLMFLEFRANQNGYGDIVALGSGESWQNDPSLVPWAIVVDRVYVHGDPLMGQKRGISLNSRDTQILNSYIADIKAVGQDSQALGGFNGPGNYVIENNYLEAAAENFILGGADPAIPNLVTTNVVFRRNHLRKPLDWRDAIVATPANVTATAAIGGGSLGAGTYAYKVVARIPAGQTTKASSKASAEVSATIVAGQTGGVSVAWTPVAGAVEYLVYGRTPGATNVYWKTTNAYFTDNGAGGTSGSPASATKWTVKNLFELKNAQDVLVEGNVFENCWVADQPGFPIVFTPRNQSGTAPWSVVQRVMFRTNLVRHAAGGVNILGEDNINPSQLTNTITIAGNVWDDINTAWGSGSKTFQIGDGGDRIVIDHNTVDTNISSLVAVYGGPATSPTPITQFTFTNNMAEHRTYGIFGANMSAGFLTINAYLPGSDIRRNVMAGGNASKYPAENFFPAVAAWKAEFVDFDGSDYHLLASSAYATAALDGGALGADVNAVMAQAANALSGDNRLPPGANHTQISTTRLPNAMLHQAYAQPLACSGGSAACIWHVENAALPQGLVFDEATGMLSGSAVAVETGSLTVNAYDPSWPTNSATATLSVTVDPTPFAVEVAAGAASQVGSTYLAQATSTGAIGSVTWTIASGSLPAGVGLDSFTGSIAGTATAWGPSSAVVQGTDSWQNRIDAKPVSVVVAPSPIGIVTATLSHGAVNRAYAGQLVANGGTGSSAWTLVSGALPAGVSLSANGAITGTPNAAGSTSFTVQVDDAGWPGNSASATLSLAVDAREIVLYAADASHVGAWSLVADASAAGGMRMSNPDAGAPKVATPAASPANYFELTFQAEAGVPYHLWIRGKAQNNSYSNDSAYVQFSGSVNASGVATNRIGTTSALAFCLEDGSGAGVAGWGWNDDAYDGFGAPIYFATSGQQTVRIQLREDGLSIDQLVLSAETFFSASPGLFKNDTTILTR